MFILLGLLGATGIVIYIVLWIVVPLEPPVGGAP
jgi:phage shock protein PspC (stress-responsive transcriptional regulator)